MSRQFRLAGLALLAAGFVLLLIVSISVPYFRALDIVRVHYGDNTLRFGIWAYCEYDAKGHATCSPTGHGYSIVIPGVIDIAASWTRGLAIHPVAAAFALIAALLTIPTKVVYTLASAVLAVLASFITLIAFAVDIALYVHVKNQMSKLTQGLADTDTTPAFWMTMVSVIVLAASSVLIFLGRNADRMSSASSYSSKSWMERLRFKS